MFPYPDGASIVSLFIPVSLTLIDGNRSYIKTFDFVLEAVLLGYISACTVVAALLTPTTSSETVAWLRSNGYPLNVPVTPLWIIAACEIETTIFVHRNSNKIPVNIV